MRYVIVILILLLSAFAKPSWAQLPDSTHQDDPFRDDPFFTKPVEELVNFNPKDWLNTDSLGKTYEYLSIKGMDRGSGSRGIYGSPLIYSMYPLLPANHYNRVDGLTLGFRKDRMRWHSGGWFFNIPSVTPTGFISRSFQSQEWQYGIGLEKYIGKKEHLMIGAEFHDANTTDDYWRAGLNETTLTAFVSSYDFLDYYNTEGFGVYAAFRTKRFFEFGVTYNNDDYESVGQETEFSLFGEDDTFRPNPEVDSTNIESISFGVSVNPKNVIMSRFFTLQSDIFVELADFDTFGNDFSFNRYEMETKLFFTIDKSTSLNIRLKAGSITGEAPVQRLYELGGIGSLRARGHKAFNNNNQMLLANTELQFRRVDSYNNGWANWNNLYISLFLDSGWTHFDEQQLNRNNPFKGFAEFNLDDLKNDLGVGFGSNLIRAELAWKTEDFGDSPAFWIRFNPTF